MSHHVEAHRGKVMQKMKADSLPDLVKMAARLGLSPRKQSNECADCQETDRSLFSPVSP